MLMPRSAKVILAMVLLLTVAGGWLWHRGAKERHWATLRPAMPASLGSAAPGLDARLAACAARFATWPPDKAALAEFAQLCQANGQLPEAMQAYQTLLVLDPAEARWPHLLAEILTGYGRMDEALPLLDRAVALAPAQPVLWHRLGEARLKSNDLPAATAAFAKLLELQPGNVHALFGLARCDLQAGRLTAARARLQEAVAADPLFPGAQSLLATVYERLGNLAAAELARQRVSGDGRYTGMPDPLAVDLLAYCHQPYTLLVAASAELSDNRPAAAIPLLERALRLDPADARLHRQLGQTRSRLGDLAGARAAFEHAVQLAPADEKIRGELIDLLRQTGDAVALERAVQEGLAAAPDSASLHYQAGRIAAAAGRTEEAIRHFLVVARLHPEESDAQRELAALYFSTNRAAEGIQVLEDVLRHQPASVPVLTMLARYGIEHRDPRTGDWLRRALAAGGSTPELAELHLAYQRRFDGSPR
jgi:predicted Zn-dependent protease